MSGKADRTTAAGVAELVLAQVNASESGVFAGVRYRDEPIVYTGAQLPSRTPKRIREMREMAHRFGWHSYAAGGAKLFNEQARFMEDFEDECPYHGEFSKYYPTYEDMPDRVLRGYFTWRSHYRAGQVEDVPLSFLFVHAYELLMGIGAKPGAGGYAALGRLRESYAGSGRAFDTHLKTWQRDYAVYHGLDAAIVRGGHTEDAALARGGRAMGSEAAALAEKPEIVPESDKAQGRDDPRRGEETPTSKPSFAQAVVTVRRAEEALLASAQPGDWPPGRWPGREVGASELFAALCVLSRYRAERSAVLRAHRDVMEEVSARAFARLVDHCRRRRKVGFVEGAFGAPTERVYRMFASAVFYEPQRHADALFRLSEVEGFACRGGRWFRLQPCRRMETSVELGQLLHEVDAALREGLGDLPPLKPGKEAPFLRKIAREEVGAVLARRAAEEAARVSIDRSVLGGIRVAAAITREALLVDEEREGFSSTEEGRPLMEEVRSEDGKELPPVILSGARGAESKDLPRSSDVGDASPASKLTEAQANLVRALLAGEFDPSAWGVGSLEMEVDAINEQFMELLGDVAIEFEDGMPCIVEDYREEIGEAVS